MLTDEELVWIREILGDYEPFQVSPSYIHKKETEYTRNQNREIVRKELDDLRDKLMKVTPDELLELRHKNSREQLGIGNFPGIYIIYNCERDKYYIGQSEKVFERSYMHFVKDLGSPEVYEDYCLGDNFSISIIPLESTKFLTLNELEDNAIRAYDALFPYGYNTVIGNILDKPIFSNNDYHKVSDLILDRIQGTEVFLSLTNNRKRMHFIMQLFKEFELPYNPNFQLNFIKVIKDYQNIIKKKK